MILEGFSKNNLPLRKENPKIGGPDKIEMLFSIETIQNDFPDFDVLDLKEVETSLRSAQKNGMHPEVVLAGRHINDAMGTYIANEIHGAMDQGGGRILVLGLTFKENVPDLRNSRVVDIIARLQELGHDVDVHDPQASPPEAQTHFGIDLIESLDAATGYDVVVGAVKHREYDGLDAAALQRLVRDGGLVADIKGIWRDVTLGDSVRRWQL